MAFVRKIDLVDKMMEVLNSLSSSVRIFVYPFGEKGRAVKKILDLCGRKAEAVDNKIDKEGVINLKKLSAIKDADIVVLLCSDSEEYYNELRLQLYEVVSLEKVIDIFSYASVKNNEMYWDPVHYYDDRVAALELAAREIYMNKVEGDVAECGVYQGDFSKYIARLLPDRSLYLFDTFSGFDSKDLDNDKLPEDMLEMFNNTSVDLVLKNIGHHVNIVVRRGWFPNTTEGLEDKRYAFVSLDTDLYDPILKGLEYFWPRMSPGGYIFVHDFGGLLGVNKAVKEFCVREHVSYVRLPDYATSAILQKPL